MPDLPFFNGIAKIGTSIRVEDWIDHPLGPPDRWPAALRYAVNMILQHPLPAVILWQNESKVLYNEAYAELGLALEEFQSLLNRVDDTSTKERIFQQVQTRRSLVFNDVAIAGRYFNYTCAPVAELDGSIGGMWLSLEETTPIVNRLKQNEILEVQRQNRDRELQLMIDILPASVVVIRGQDLIVEMINRSNLEYWNKSAVEVLGKPFLDILPDLANQPFAGQLRHVMTTGEIIDVKESPVIFKNADGTYRETYVDYTYQPLTDANGIRNGVLVMSFEITERVAARKLLEQYAEELRQANELLTMANKELAISEARFKYLIREAPVAIAVLKGAEMIIDSANDMILQIWGKPPEIMGMTLSGALPELEGQPFLPILNEVYTSGKPYYGNEVLAQLVHGERLKELFLNFVYQPIKNTDAQISDILVVALDVTAQVSARKEIQQINEKLLATNEELAATNKALTRIQRRYEEAHRELATYASRLRMAIESTGLGTWEYNPESGELYWSAECREIYGFPLNNTVTFEIFAAHVHPDDADRVNVAIAQALNFGGDGHYDLNYRILRFDSGESRWIRAQGSVYFEDNRAVRFIGTVVDIQDLKLAEEKSAKLAAIIETSDDAIISKTLEGIITSWNNSARRVFGYHAEEMIGESIYKLIPEDRYDEEPYILSTLKRGERINHFETRRLTKDGRLIDVSVTVSPVMDKNGNIIGVSKIARDITEKKLDEARKNDFIAMVSHELKTPLTSLAAIVQLAHVKLKNSEQSFLANAMEKANNQVKRMTAMINGFLNVSRLESGKIQINKEQFDLVKLISEVVEEVRLTSASQKITLSGVECVMIDADREKISSVVSNLISNAIKYAPNAEQVSVSCLLDSNKAIVSVRDEGIGIKPDDLERVFERYHRIETEQTKNISGFGIGLYLSAEIIKCHHGEIWAESKEGFGSIFYFSLPLTA